MVVVEIKFMAIMRKTFGRLGYFKLLYLQTYFQIAEIYIKKVSNSGAFCAAAIFLNFYPGVGFAYLTETSILIKEKQKHFWRRF